MQQWSVIRRSDNEQAGQLHVLRTPNVMYGVDKTTIFDTFTSEASYVMSVSDDSSGIGKLNNCNLNLQIVCLIHVSGTTTYYHEFSWAMKFHLDNHIS